MNKNITLKIIILYNESIMEDTMVKCLPSIYKEGYTFDPQHNSCMMWHMPEISAYREVQAGWSEIQGNSQQHRKLEASLEYIKCFLKNNVTKKV